MGEYLIDACTGWEFEFRIEGYLSVCNISKIIYISSIINHSMTTYIPILSYINLI